MRVNQALRRLLCRVALGGIVAVAGLTGSAEAAVTWGGVLSGLPWASGSGGVGAGRAGRSLDRPPKRFGSSRLSPAAPEGVRLADPTMTRTSLSHISRTIFECCIWARISCTAFRTRWAT